MRGMVSVITAVQGIMTMTPSESKRLIAGAIAAIPAIRAALAQGRTPRALT